MSRALILMYHAVDDPRSAAEARYCVSPGRFRAQMAYLADAGCARIPLTALVQVITAGDSFPANAVAVTFDDGFECFRSNALPVLTEFQIPATVFAVAGHLGDTNTWMQAKGWPVRRLMDRQALCEIQTVSVTIGCHALSHRPMTTLSAVALVEETAGARRILSDALGSNVSLFAYPYGEQGERERQAVAQAGFAAACGTQPGFNRRDTDLFALRRIDVYGSDNLADFRRKLEFGANRVTHGDLARYYLSRLTARIHAGSH
jgi:peptidoglycan/xylan/chitin deacetylase (PgdA/CDA1 family)